MSVRIQGSNEGGVFFITITCTRWLPFLAIYKLQESQRF
jgi:hypothetical protein